MLSTGGGRAGGEGRGRTVWEGRRGAGWRRITGIINVLLSQDPGVGEHGQEHGSLMIIIIFAFLMMVIITIIVNYHSSPSSSPSPIPSPGAISLDLRSFQAAGPWLGGPGAAMRAPPLTLACIQDTKSSAAQGHRLRDRAVAPEGSPTSRRGEKGLLVLLCLLSQSFSTTCEMAGYSKQWKQVEAFAASTYEIAVTYGKVRYCAAWTVDCVVLPVGPSHTA